MKNTNILSISVILLAISILAGSILIANALKTETPAVGSSERSINYTDKILINMEEASLFLGIPVEDIQQIITKEQNHLDEYHEFSGMMFPFIKLNDDFYFSKETLEEWVKEKVANRIDFVYYPSF